MNELKNEIWNKQNVFIYRFGEMPSGVVLSIPDFHEYLREYTFKGFWPLLEGKEQPYMFGFPVYSSAEIEKGTFKLCLPDEF